MSKKDISLDTIIENSKIYKEINEKLQFADVVSFDIFDTLLNRKCGKPEDIFLKIKKRLDAADKESYQTIRKQAEIKARKKYKDLEDISLNDILLEITKNKKELEELEKIEIDLEAKNSIANPIIEKIHKEANRQKVYISDMYLSKKQIKKITGNKLNFSGPIYVSSEHNKTKRSGNLFKKVSVNLGISPEKILHIGDNEFSDLIQAKKSGYQAIHFEYSKYVEEVISLESSLGANVSRKINLARRTAAALTPFQKNTDQNTFFEIGSTVLGPIINGFSKWVVKKCKQKKIETILCLMREGETLSRYIEMYADAGSCKKLYVSRKSTFLASVNEENYEEKIGGLFKTNGLQVEALFDILQKQLPKYIELAKKDLIRSPSTENADIINKAILDIKDKQDILKKSIGEKIKVKKYINSISRCKRCATVDLGAAGTIQTSIRYIVENKKFFDFYLFTTENPLSGKNNNNTYSFLPNNKETKRYLSFIRRSQDVLEVLLNGAIGTTLRYEENEVRVIPITDYGENNDKKHLFKAMQKGIESYISCSNHYNCNETSQSQRQALTKSIYRLIHIPTANEARELSKLKHNIGFGVKDLKNIAEEGAFDTNDKQNAINLLYAINRNQNHLKHQIIWPQGLITLSHPELIKTTMNLQHSEDEHQELISRLVNKCIEKNIQEVIVYGAGAFFQKLKPALNNESIKIKYAIDQKARFGIKIICGTPVKSLDEVNIDNNIVILIASAAFTQEIEKIIVGLGVSEENIITPN